MSLQCWKCGATLSLLLPLSRTEACPSCQAELHSCRMCRHYDAGRAKQCRELAAEPVSDKVRANFCGWFVPRPDAYKGGGAAVAQASRGALDALFGQAGSDAAPSQATSTQAASATRSLLDDLFKK